MDKSKNGTLVLSKAPTGVKGFDEITGGGLPSGRPTLIFGGPGCGKTLFSLQFIAHGALHEGENGVVISFEESPEELMINAGSIGLDLQTLIDQKKIAVDFIKFDPHELNEAGTYNLEGLFLRLEAVIAEVNAKRVAIDTLESLFTIFSRRDIIRAEISRLFRWLKERNLTTIVTGEVGPNTSSNSTRYGLEEYISDCVIYLDNRVENQITTRRLRIVKYRGSSHGTNEYPFLISDLGINVLPVTSIGLDYEVSKERISTGIPDLDEMLGGKGVFRGSTILISGTAGTGKSTIGAYFVNAACERKEKALFISFEESPYQIMRNMTSIGLNLKKFVDKGLLKIVAFRPTMFGLEMHLINIMHLIQQENPSVVVLDPINSFLTDVREHDVKLMLMRLTDFIKSKNITGMMLSLTGGGEHTERTNVAISSIVDTWIILRDIEQSGERNRGLYILKSRGHKHSNQIREFKLSDRGLKLIEVYRGLAGVLTGSARIAQEAKEELEQLEYKQEIERLLNKLENRRRTLENQIEIIKANFDAETKEIELQIEQLKHRQSVLEERKKMIGKMRS
ncbi:MAG: circadian clock protein KaiC [Calditrichaeota bacterium]|nr:circadian clock protein KaiC [Calditrichota bacterium]